MTSKRKLLGGKAPAKARRVSLPASRYTSIAPGQKPITKRERQFFAFVHKGAPLGVTYKRPKLRAQDKRAKPNTMYAVVFFPKINSLGPAKIYFYQLRETLSQSPEAARVRFMDKIRQGEKWATYADAGHRVRKIRITDLGDAK